MHTIWKGSPYGERISGAGLLGLTEYKQAQAMPCNLSNFLLSLRASARRATFFIRDFNFRWGESVGNHAKYKSHKQFCDISFRNCTRSSGFHGELLLAFFKHESFDCNRERNIGWERLLKMKSSADKTAKVKSSHSRRQSRANKRSGICAVCTTDEAAAPSLRNPNSAVMSFSVWIEKN